MKRITLLLGITAITALVAVSVAAARPDPGVLTCVTSLNNLSNANINALAQQGVAADTIPGAFNLPQGLSNQVVSSGDGNVGECSNGGGGDNGGDGDNGGGGGGDNGGGNTAGNTPGQAPPPEGNVFLCYSSFGNVPGVWPIDVAKTLVADGGYWLAYAVAGNVDGGTNIGGYHLVCNLGGTQSVTPGVVGGAGEVLGGGNNGDFGFYPVLGS
jgi:hypothetical protein